MLKLSPRAKPTSVTPASSANSIARLDGADTEIGATRRVSSSCNSHLMRVDVEAVAPREADERYAGLFGELDREARWRRHRDRGDAPCFIQLQFAPHARRC